MTPTPYVGGRKPRNAKPHSRDRAERTLDNHRKEPAMPPGGWRAGRKKRVDQLWHHSSAASLPALESRPPQKGEGESNGHAPV